jgi:hypothetical protein
VASSKIDRTDNPDDQYRRLDMSSRREFDQSERSVRNRLMEDIDDVDSPNISRYMEEPTMK